MHRQSESIEAISMEAKIGDRLVVHSQHVGESEREGEILEVRGDGGGPPFVVRWSDGQEGLIFPGPDASVQSAGPN